jgi:hypothetical protein
LVARQTPKPAAVEALVFVVVQVWNLLEVRCPFAVEAVGVAWQVAVYCLDLLTLETPALVVGCLSVLVSLRQEHQVISSCSPAHQRADAQVTSRWQVVNLVLQVAEV